MTLDRSLQREILKQLRNVYPEGKDFDELPEGDRELQVNLFYLHEHDLIDGLVRESIGVQRAVHYATITAKGLDFLEDDGGIDAILRTVTVRFDPEDLRRLIEAKVETSTMTEHDKKSLSHAIRSLPSEALQHLTYRILDSAMDRVPDVLQLVQKCVGLSP